MLNSNKEEQERGSKESSQIEGQFLWKLLAPWKPHLPISKQKKNSNVNKPCGLLISASAVMPVL